MSTQIEKPILASFEKVLSQNTIFAEKFLGAFKKVINNTSILPNDELSNTTIEYLQNSLLNLNISLPNEKELSTFLLKHIDGIQPIIVICKEIRNKFPEVNKMKLIYEVETEDNSGSESITLYTQLDKDFLEVDAKIEELVSNYDNYFIDSGILFTVQVCN